jgi:hypothetical protein
VDFGNILAIEGSVLNLGLIGFSLNEYRYGIIPTVFLILPALK